MRTPEEMAKLCIECAVVASDDGEIAEAAALLAAWRDECVEASGHPQRQIDALGKVIEEKQAHIEAAEAERDRLKAKIEEMVHFVDVLNIIVSEREDSIHDLREENGALRAHIAKRLESYSEFSDSDLDEHEALGIFPPWIKEARALLRAEGGES